MLVLEHTYRRDYPWGLPGGYLQAREDPAEGLAREVSEELGLKVRVAELLAAGLFEQHQLDLLYRVQVLSGEPRATAEVSGWRFTATSELGHILPNQRTMLVRAGVIPETGATGPDLPH